MNQRSLFMELAAGSIDSCATHVGSREAVSAMSRPCESRTENSSVWNCVFQDIPKRRFARRFAVYKRPYLLLQDPDRLIRLLTDAGSRSSSSWPVRHIPRTSPDSG